MRGVGMPGPTTTSPPCSTRSLDAIPAPDGDADAPLQALVTNLDASDYLGRLAIGRVVERRAAAAARRSRCSTRRSTRAQSPAQAAARRS